MAYLKTDKDGKMYVYIKGLKNQRYKSKSIPLLTRNKSIAESRLSMVKKKESLIKYDYIPQCELYSMFTWLREDKKIVGSTEGSFNRLSSESKKRAISNDITENRYSYIYIIHASGTNFYKIGKANSLSGRVRTLQTNCMYKLNAIYNFKFPENATISIEKSIQNTLSIYQTESSNEWFIFANSQLENIVSILKAYANIYKTIKPVINKGLIVSKEKSNAIIPRKSGKVDMEYNEKQKIWYLWKVRAEAVNIPMLPGGRPKKEDRAFWEKSIIAAENDTTV